MKVFISRSCIVFVFIALLTGCGEGRKPAEMVYDRFEEDLVTLMARNEDFLGKVRSGSSKEELQEEFIALRLQYKKVEGFAEYFFPSTIRLVNGAPLDEVEDEENAIFEPGGFQVIEELIYTDEKIDHEELVRHVRKTQVNIKRMKTLWEDIQFTDSHVFDGLRLELFRLITLGISGFDTPASGNALEEGQVVLQSVRDYLDIYSDKIPQGDSLNKQIEASIDFLKKAKDFNSFDRAAFITEHINPLCRLLHKSQQQASIPFIKDRKMLSSRVATLFDEGAFQPEALVSNEQFAATSGRIELGKRLFFEVKLSGNGKTSCGSCHQPALAYSDGMKTSMGTGNLNIKRNAPTITYASLQQSLFYDLRSPSLEDQAADVIHNKDEMHGSLSDMVRLIASDESYKKAFMAAYPKLDSVQPVYIQNALATFVRSLSPFNAPFDQYMRGEKRALTDDQFAGFNLFMGKAKCGTCHFMPLFNGTVPPDYQRTESEVLGVTVNADWKHPQIDSDKGRGAHNKFPQWQHAFKTSSLRNIAKTAPYMHNGALTTLDEVMEFYNEGGGAGLGLQVENQTLAPDKLNLTSAEMRKVVLFMESLNDAK